MFGWNKGSCRFQWHFRREDLWDAASGISHTLLLEKREGAGKGKEKDKSMSYGCPCPPLITRCFQDEANSFGLLSSSSPLSVWACCQENISCGTLPQCCPGNTSPLCLRHPSSVRRSSAHEQVHSGQGGAEGARPGSSAGRKAAGAARGQGCPASPPWTLMAGFT